MADYADLYNASVSPAQEPDAGPATGQAATVADAAAVDAAQSLEGGAKSPRKPRRVNGGVTNGTAGVNRLPAAASTAASHFRSSRTQTREQQLRDRWDLPESVAIGLVDACPLDYKKVKLSDVQRNFLHCAADTGVAYFLEGSNDLACMNPARCAVSATGPPRNAAETRRESIALLNKLLPRYNAAAVWARRNWIVQHACVPCISMEDANAYLKASATAADYDKVKYPYQLTTVNRRHGQQPLTKAGAPAVVLVTRDGNIDWKVMQEWDAYLQAVEVVWVPLYPRKDTRGSLSSDWGLTPAGRELVRATITTMLDQQAMWNMLGKRTNEAWGTMGRLLEMHPGVTNVADANPEDTSINLQNEGFHKDFAAFRAKFYNGGFDLTTTKYQGKEVGWNQHVKVNLLESSDECSKTTISTFEWDAANKNIKPKDLEIKELNTTPSATTKYKPTTKTTPKDLFTEAVINPLLAVKAYKAALAKPKLTEFVECKFQPEWRIQCRDIDLRLAIVTGMEILAVDAVLDESQYAVYPTALFVWDHQLERLAEWVQDKVKRRSARVFVEALSDILYMNRELKDQLMGNDAKDGGLRDLVNDPASELTSLSDVADKAVQVLLRCQEKQAQNPGRTAKDWEDAGKAGEKFTMVGMDPSKKIPITDVCKPVTLSNNEVRLIPQFQQKYGFEERKGTDGDPLPSRFDEDPHSKEAKFFHDISRFHRAEAAKVDAQRAYLLGESGAAAAADVKV